MDFVNAVTNMADFFEYNHGRPVVQLLGINLDGSLNKPFLDFLQQLAGAKFPATVNSLSYMVRRSFAVTRWIRNLQVAFLRSVSDNTVKSAAMYFAQSHEVIDSMVTNMTSSHSST